MQQIQHQMFAAGRLYFDFEGVFLCILFFYFKIKDTT